MLEGGQDARAPRDGRDGTGREPTVSGGSRSYIALPLGAAVLAAVPAMWDFATSGLETGLSFGWLGLSFYLLARLTRIETQGATAPTVALLEHGAALVVGLGPLIRPDLGIFSGAFLVALLLEHAARARRRWPIGGWARLLAVAVQVPAAYQVFRMGYYAALVPNPALAKEAGQAYWTQGWRYAADFFGTYALWLPLLCLALWWLAALRHAGRRGDLRALALLAAPTLAAVLHALYVIRVGGDFMHGRLLLPSLFGALLPVATVVVPLPRYRPWSRLAFAAASAVAVGWALICAVWLRVPYSPEGRNGIADERAYYVRASGVPNPVTTADYEAAVFAQQGRYLRSLAEQGYSSLSSSVGEAPGVAPARTLLIVETETPQESQQPVLPLASWVVPDVRLVIGVRNIGLAGYNAGPRAHLVDRVGLSDPIAARLDLRTRGRPGHEKTLPNAWIIARFADTAPELAATEHVAAAWDALRCGDLARLMRAIEEPVSLSRFADNLLLAWQSRALRIPADPLEARRALCR